MSRQKEGENGAIEEAGKKKEEANVEMFSFFIK